LGKSSTASHCTGDIFPFLKLNIQILFKFEFHFVVNDGFVKDVVSGSYLFLHKYFLIQSGTDTYLGVVSEFLKLTDELFDVEGG
jgi:hypothetical protein